MNKLLLKSAFTLAEVLITLAIIGLVAALTIPVILNDTDETEQISAWKKAYAVVSTVTTQIISENGGTLENLFNNSNDIRDAYAKYLIVGKTCNAGSGKGVCYASYVANMNKVDGTPSDINGSLLLRNGYTLWFNLNDKTCSTGSPVRCGYIWIDVNGLKKPNVYGKDVFVVHLLKNSVKPIGFEVPASDWYDTTKSFSCTSQTLGRYCAAAYLVK